MIPNIHQSINQIIESAAPEQRVIWQQVQLIVGERAAVRQLYYAGAIAGSEFLTYSANKLYLAIEMNTSFTSGGVQAAAGQIVIYDENNTATNRYSRQAPIWDATAAAAKYSLLPIYFTNLYFGRITVTTYTDIKFIGYRLTR